MLRTGMISLTSDVSAFDVAATLNGKITGATLVAVGPERLLYVVDPTKDWTTRSSADCHRPSLGHN